MPPATRHVFEARAVAALEAAATLLHWCPAAVHSRRRGKVRGLMSVGSKKTWSPRSATGHYRARVEDEPGVS
jgi:hypothetical protein